MKIDPSQRLLWAAVSLLLVTLVALATLQYRWIGRLSRIEGDRMRASIELSTLRFATDLNSELSRAFGHFQRGVLGIRAGGGGDDLESRAIRLFDEWRSLSAYPELYAGLLSMPAGPAGPYRRFYAGESSFEDAEEAGELDAWPSFPDRFGHLPFSDSLDGLVVGVFGAPPISLRRGGRPPWDLAAPDGYLVVLLDSEELVDVVLPDLGAFHFGPVDGAALDFAVLDRSGEPLFVSTGGEDFPLEGGFDARAGLLRMTSPDEGRRGRRRGPPLRGRSAEPSGQAGERPVWELVVRHRAGSLDAAVAGARSRNLAVSFGVLLVLVATIGALFLATRRAQRLAREQVAFVAGISHELRTPLAAMRSLGENLADGIVRSDEQVERYGQQVKRHAGRLTALVDQALAFAGGLSESPGGPRTPIDFDALVTEAIGECREEAVRFGGVVRRRVAAPLPRLVGDAQALRGMLRNLVSNALKYGGPSPEVEIELESAGLGVSISVSDRGSGVDPVDRERIFEPFYRAASARDAQIEGTGLGLGLVRDVASAHGGTVRWEPNGAVGSRFVVELPVEGEA